MVFLRVRIMIGGRLGHLAADDAFQRRFAPTWRSTPRPRPRRSPAPVRCGCAGRRSTSRARAALRPRPRSGCGCRARRCTRPAGFRCATRFLSNCAEQRPEQLRFVELDADPRLLAGSAVEREVGAIDRGELGALRLGLAAKLGVGSLPLLLRRRAGLRLLARHQAVTFKVGCTALAPARLLGPASTDSTSIRSPICRIGVDDMHRLQPGRFADQLARLACPCRSSSTRVRLPTVAWLKACCCSFSSGLQALQPFVHDSRGDLIVHRRSGRAGARANI